MYSWGTCHPWRWTNTRLAPTRSGECDQCGGNLNRVFDGDISLSSGKDWNYDDPSCWSTKFPLCGEGQRQSPIQIHRLGVNRCEADVNQEIIIKLSSSSPFPLLPPPPPVAGLISRLWGRTWAHDFTCWVAGSRSSLTRLSKRQCLGPAVKIASVQVDCSGDELPSIRTTS